uniref:uncharacterized protein LOC120338924 isoform X1 n=1 Tax=Styela clava TaxID=7725 RepID=UPI00193A03A9|nr:uncharacterized protein LOC120338924 isoform X1 [Styela clava]
MSKTDEKPTLHLKLKGVTGQQFLPGLINNSFHNKMDKSQLENLSIKAEDFIVKENCNEELHEDIATRTTCPCEACLHRLTLNTNAVKQHGVHAKGWNMLREVITGLKDSPNEETIDKKEILSKLTQYNPHLLFQRLELSIKQYISGKKVQLLKLLAQGYENPLSALDVANTLLNMYADILEVAGTLSNLVKDMDSLHLAKLGTSLVKWTKCLFQHIVCAEPLVHHALPELLVQLRKGITKDSSDANFSDILHRFLHFGDEMMQLQVEWKSTLSRINDHSKKHSLVMSKYRYLHHVDRSVVVAMSECLRQHPPMQNNPVLSNLAPFLSIPSFPSFPDSYGSCYFNSLVEVCQNGETLDIAPGMNPGIPSVYDIKINPPSVPSDDSMVSSDEEVEPKYLNRRIYGRIPPIYCDETGGIVGGNVMSETLESSSHLPRYQCDIPYTIPTTLSASPLITGPMLQARHGVLENGISRRVGANSEIEDEEERDGGEADDEDEEGRVTRCSCSQCSSSFPKSLHLSSEHVPYSCDGAGVGAGFCTNFATLSQTTFTLTNPQRHGLVQQQQHLYAPVIQESPLNNKNTQQWNFLHAGIGNYGHSVDPTPEGNTDQSSYFNSCSCMEKSDNPTYSSIGTASNINSVHHHPPLVPVMTCASLQYAFPFPKFSQGVDANSLSLQPPSIPGIPQTSPGHFQDCPRLLQPQFFAAGNNFSIPGTATTLDPTSNGNYSQGLPLQLPACGSPVISTVQQQRQQFTSNATSQFNAQCQSPSSVTVSENTITTTSPVTTASNQTHRKKLVPHGKLARQQMQKKPASQQSSTPTLLPTMSSSLPRFELNNDAQTMANDKVPPQLTKNFKFETSPQDNIAKQPVKAGSIPHEHHEGCTAQHHTMNTATGDTDLRHISTTENAASSQTSAACSASSAPPACSEQHTHVNSGGTPKVKHNHSHNHQNTGSGEPTACCNQEECSSDAASNGQNGNSGGGSKYCDCCYCEFFGNGGPPLAPTSKNYPEMRERLRSKLNKKPRGESKDAGNHSGHHHDERSLEEILSFIEGERMGNGHNDGNKKNVKKSKQKVNREEDKRKTEKQQQQQQDKAALTRSKDTKCPPSDVQPPVVDNVQSNKQALNKKRKTRKKQNNSDELITTEQRSVVNSPLNQQIHANKDMKNISNESQSQKKTPVQVRSSMQNNATSSTKTKSKLNDSVTGGHHSNENNIKQRLTVNSVQSPEISKYSDKYGKNKHSASQKSSEQSTKYQAEGGKEKQSQKSEGKASKKNAKQAAGALPIDPVDVVHVDQVFMPKGDNQENNEMDDIEKEIDSFKRFCLDSTNFVRRKKISVNWKDFSFKKNHISH